MLFKTLEQVERTVFNLSYSLKVKNVIILGDKNADKKRLGPYWVKDYDSKKYSNMDKLKRGNLKCSEFLTFNFFEKNGDSSIFETIFISHNNMYTLLEAFRKMQKYYDKNKKEMFKLKNNQLFLKKEHSDVHSKISIKSNDVTKKMVLRFDVGVNRETEENFRAISIILVDDEKISTVEMTTFTNFVHFLETFNLSQASISLMTYSALEELSMFSKNNGDSSPKSYGKSNSGKGKPRKILDEEEVTENNSDEVFDNSEGETKKPSSKKSSKNEDDEDSSSGKKNKKNKKSKKNKKINIEKLIDQDDDSEDVEF